jgi:hypothetical protein
MQAKGSQRRADFFLVGAPKCGTTSLAEYLRAHPNIFMCLPKEPFFFCEDFPGLPRVATLDAYVKLFRDAPAEALALGEASAMYLYSKVALENVRRFNPDARIIVMVRNPVELAHSFHSEMLYAQNEDELDFARAWKLQAERAKGRRVPPLCWESSFLQYRDVARLGVQVERLLTVFPRNQIHLIVFEDFVRDTQRVYERVLTFLGLSSDGRSEFPRMNQNKIVRSRWIARFTQRPPAPLTRAARATKEALGIQRLSFLGSLRNLNLKRGSREPLSRSVRERIIKEFADDVDLLSSLLDRDFSYWVRSEDQSEAAAEN